MSVILEAKRDDVQIIGQDEYENIIRIPVEDKKKSIPLIVKIIVGILVLSFFVIVLSCGQAKETIQPKNRSLVNLKSQQQKQQYNEKFIIDKSLSTENKNTDNNKNFKHNPKKKQSDIQEDPTANETDNDKIKTIKINDNDTEQNNQNEKGTDQNSNEQMNKNFINQNEVNENTLLWGHYKPHLIYNLSQRKNNPVSMSMSYIPDMESSECHTKYGEKAGKTDVFYDFKYNDGVRFSQFVIDDQRFNFKVESVFIKQQAEENTQKWINQHKIHKSNLFSNRQNKSLIFSLSKEIYDVINLKNDSKYYHFQYKLNNEAIEVNVFSLQYNSIDYLGDSSTKFVGSFIFTVQKNKTILKGKTLMQIIRYSQISDVESDQIWNISNSIFDNIYRVTKELNNQVIENSLVKLLLIQFIFEQNEEYTVDIQFNSEKKANEQEILNSNQFPEILNQLIDQYEEQLKKSIESKGISDYHQCTVAALSNLLGGMTYKYGQLQYTQREEQQNSVPKAIFSFTPSRTRFGWSFLWDDGFHNAIASKFQPKLSAFVIKSWLDSMNENGWICREQTRGEEAFGLCSCAAFIKKDNRDGNPPSLILALEYFLRDHTDIIQEMINEGYFEKIEKWYHWYLKSQMVKDETFKGNQDDFTDIDQNSFVFKYWDIYDKMFSMNSGLDDYPRYDDSLPYSFPMGHIDAQSWMYHFTTIMEKMSIFIQDNQKIEYYTLLRKTIQQRTEEFFYDDSEFIYKDILSQRNSLRDITFSPHFGYPNLLPLAFGLIKDNKYELSSILKKIQNPQILWTDYGLRSLSKSDQFFGRGNNYWTGPIWIQMNYLVLRGLKLYYNQNSDAVLLYNNLRRNVQNVVCSNWEKTGFFYENYNKYNNGLGSDAFPFTGWTATISLINAENY